MKRMKKKSLLLVAGIVLMLTIAIGGTIAYLVTNTDSITNTFEPGGVPISVDESFTGGVKSDVKITNDGNVPAYIRAKIIVTWKNAQGEVSGTPVQASDYSMIINTADWTKAADGFYYYKESVEATGKTTNLINSCTKLEGANPPDDYDLSVEIIAESIQADGMDGVSNAQQAFAKANGNQ